MPFIPTAALASPGISSAVILAPGTSVRNKIQPASDVTPLSLFGAAGGTADIFSAGVTGSDPFFRLDAQNALGLGAGTFDPSLYGGAFATRFVVSNNDLGSYDANAGPAIDPGSGDACQAFLDSQINPSSDGVGSGHYGLYGAARFTGTKTAPYLTGLYYLASMRGTKSGNQVADVYGAYFEAVTGSTSTGGVDLITAVAGISTVNADNPINGAVNGGFFGAGEDYGSGAAIPKMSGAFLSIYSSGRTVTQGIGLEVAAPGTPGSFTTLYGIKLLSHSGAATKSYAFYSEGGSSEFRAGASTEIPLTLRGATSQSANLFVTEDVNGNDLVAISAAGVVLFGTSADVNLYRSAADKLKTDDMLLAVAGIGVGNSAAASSSVGSLARKIEVFDASGSSLGFIPVYATIT